MGTSGVRSTAELIDWLSSFPGQKTGDLDALDDAIREAVSIPRNDDVDRALFG